MDNQNIENWEHELKNKLGNHKEVTDSKDLDAFMGKLDNNNFFKSSGKSFSGTWAFVTGVAITGVAIWMLNGEQLEEQQPAISPVTEIQTVEGTQEKSEEVEIFDNGGIAEIEEGEDTIPADLDEEPMVEDKIEEKPKVIRKKVVATKTVSKKVVKAVPAVDESKEEPKIVPVARKRTVIMITDTTVVTDTTHVKLRKKEIRKKK